MKMKDSIWLMAYSLWKTENECNAGKDSKEQGVKTIHCNKTLCCKQTPYDHDMIERKIRSGIQGRHFVANKRKCCNKTLRCHPHLYPLPSRERKSKEQSHFRRLIHSTSSGQGLRLPFSINEKQS